MGRRGPAALLLLLLMLSALLNPLVNAVIDVLCVGVLIAAWLACGLMGQWVKTSRFFISRSVLWGPLWMLYLAWKPWRDL
jgi:hypothetical protein